MLARLWRRETEARSTAQPALLAAVPDRRPELAPCLIVPNFRARSPAEIAVPKRRRRRIQVESLYREVEPEPRRHARALVQLIQIECPHIVGKYVPHLHLERAYDELCERERWKPRHWTSLGRHLGDLTHKKVVKRDGKRFTAYRMPRP